MKPWEQRSFNVAAGIVTATGIAYFVMKFMLTSEDPFAIVNHPWQPSMLAAHVVSAPVLVWLFGVIFRSHSLKKILSPVRSNRRSGWTSLISFAAMALSGYLLQVATTPRWIDAFVVLHVGASVVFVVGYALHLVVGWRLTWLASRSARAPRLMPDRPLPR